MRRQDELLAVYPSADPQVKKFILAETEGLALTFDSDELLECLRSERENKDPAVRHQAVFALLSFLPGFIRRRYSLSVPTKGMWTGYGHRFADGQSSKEQTNDQDRLRIEQKEAGLCLAHPLADPLMRLAKGANPRLIRQARLALALFPLPEIKSALWTEVASGPVRYETLLPFSFSASSVEDEELLVKAVRESARGKPELLLLLSKAPSALGFEVLVDLAARTNTLGRVNLALALSKMENADHESAVDHLTKREEGWVIVYCLRALEATRQPKSLARIRRIYEASEHPFLKAQAVRAAGGIPSPESVEFCLFALDSKCDEVKAQSLESLVRLHAPLETLRQAAAPFLNGSALRARVNAILACVQPEDDQLACELVELLLSQDTVTRAEGAFCLGYLQNRPALECLATLADADPSLHVRIQAIKSLSKYPADLSCDTLLALLKHQEPRVSLTAARVLSRYGGEEGSLVCERLVRSLSNAARGFERALIYQTLGSIAGKIRYAVAVPSMSNGLEECDRIALQGAVEGWVSLGGLGAEQVAKPLKDIVAKKDPRMAPRALLALLVRGHVDAVDGLCSLLYSPDPNVVGPALETALEVVLLLSGGGLMARFPGLAAQLKVTERGDNGPSAQGESAVELDPSRPLAIQGLDSRRLADGVFEVRRTSTVRSIALGRRQGGNGPRTVQPVEAGVSDRPGRERDRFDSASIGLLRSHLLSLKAAMEGEPTRFVSRLWEVTYLIPRWLTGPSLLEKLGSYRGLILPVAAAVLVVGLLALATLRRVSVDVLSRTEPLSTGQVVGKVLCIRDGTDSPVVGGEPVRIGSRYVTRENSSLTLSTLSGNRVVMRSDSTVTVKRVAETVPDVSLVVAMGHFVFDWSKTGRLEVEFRKVRIECDRAVFSLTNHGGRFCLIVDSGRVLVVSGPGASAEEVGPGSLKPLE